MSAALALGFSAPSANAAQVQHLNTQTATATGAGATGKPTLASFSIPSGKNRALFIWGTFERDHCSAADTSGGLCTSGNTAGTGLGDNWPEPRIGTPPATTTNNQITAQVVGPGGTINKQNALVIGGTPSGDTRFITISTSPTGSPAGTAFFGVSSFHIALFETEINTLLGGAASGTVSISFPDVTTPSGAGDDAMMIASVFQNVEQTVTGFVRNATATAQVTTGTPGNFSMAPAAYDAGQAPDEADDGKLVMGANSSIEGFLLPAGHVALATVGTSNAAGQYDTPNGNVNNEPNGFSGGAYFRNGGATPGSLYTLQSAAAAATLVYGGTNASFLLESDNADVSDAPISYGNATHTLSGIRMGASVDADASLLNNATAIGDDINNTDDEDGVSLTPLLPIGYTTVVPVSIANASGFLSAWFDWNADGDFNDTGEQMVANQAVTVGVVNLNIAVPSGAVIGPTFARFRVCTNNTALDNCGTPTGTVQSGEVEDYQFQVNRALVLNKITVGGVGGPFGFTLTNTGQATGSVSTTVPNVPAQVDGNTGFAGVQPFAVVAPTTAVTISESALPVGWSLLGATCFNASNAQVGSLSGSTYTITGAEIAASPSFTCTFTNRKLPILRLQKSLPTGRFAAGDQFQLTITGSGGPASVTTTGAGSTATGVATLNPGAVGALYTFAEAGASGANLANYATTYACTNALTGGQEPSGSGTSFSVTAVAGDDLTCVFTNSGAPQLTLSKTASASPWTVGVPASYTLQVSNTGTAATTAAATITDTIPVGLTIGSLPAGCTAAGQTVTCTIASGLAAAASTSFVIPVTPTAAAVPSVTNTATVSGGGDPGCPAAARCTDTEGPTTVSAPELTLSKTASASPWTVGVPASYTLQVSNTGTAATTAAATISDTIPAGLTIGTLPAGCTAAGQTVTCTIASGLAAAASTSFVIPVTPTAAAVPSVTNTATVSGGGDPGCPAAARCTDTEGPTTVNAPELTLSKTASASPWTVGVPASYTLQVSNTGTAATTAAATISDTIPAGLTIGTLPAGCTAAGQTVTCTIASGLAAAASSSFVIPVTPTAAATPSVTNTATVSGGGDPGCPAAARCTDTEGPTTVNALELTLSKTASASPWTVGVSASYTLQVSNTGTAATTATATITDTMPAGLTIGTLPAGCTAAGQTVTCTIASGLAAAASTSFVIPVTPTAAAVPSVTNTATVSGGGDPGCPAAARCTDTEGPTTVNAPELTLSKTASASPWTVGVPASYTLQVSNTGTAATTAAATITDAIPAGLTIGALPVGCTAAGQTVTCTVASGLAAGGSTSFVIPVTPTVAATPSVTNTATVSGGGDVGCPAAARCTDTEGPTTVNAPELTLSKTASASPWTVGVPASYTLQVGNTGTTATTAAATITDTIPAGLTIGTLPAGCTAAGQTVTCTIASGLAAAASTSFVIPVTPTVAATPSVTNMATVSGGGDPGCPAAARCTDTEGPTTVNAPELTLTKTASASPWTVGVPASYTLQVSNTGTAATTAAATVTDTIPAGLMIGTLPAGCTAAGQTVTCTFASGLAAGGSTSFVIPVTPTAAAVPSVTNTATVSGGGDPGCPAAARCTDTEGPTTVNAPELTLSKTASASPWTVGVPASYTLQVGNTGTTATTAAATVTDTIPAGLTIGTMPVGCTAAGQTVTCTVASGLAAAASTSFVIPVTPTAAATPSVTNAATVSGGGDPGCPAAARCTDTEGPTTVNAPELTLSKTASASPWTVGVPASYMLQVSNTGTAATTAIATITDTMPAGLTIGTLPAGCSAAGQTVTCTIASGLAAAASTSFVIPVTPTAAAVPSVTNTATVSGGGDPSCPAAARCTDTEGPTTVNAPELTLSKTASASPWTVGVPASYTLQVGNTGTTATTAAATITDTIPAGLTIGTLPAGCTAAGQTITCTIASGLAAAASTSFVVPVTPTVAATPSVTNTATVSGGGDQGCPAAVRCSDTEGPTPVDTPELTLTKTASASPWTVGVPASYTLQVSNTGTAATTATATITDAIPAGLTIGTLPAGCTAAGQTVTCTIASGLAAAASTSFVIPVTPTVAATPSVTNTATVSGGGDPGCPAAARCTDTEGPTTVNAPELTLAKTASASPWTVGVPASYTLQISNTGTAATTAAATISDTIPAGLTIGTLPAGCTAAGQTVTCIIASGLAAAASTSFVVPVTPTVAATPSVTNTATVSGGGDPNCPAAARCTDTEGPTTVNAPELTLTKTASASPWTVGVPASYTLQVSNTGTAATTAAATVTDTIPAGLMIGTLPAGCTAAGQTVTCTFASGLAAGGSTSFVIPVTPTAAAVPSVTNTATVSGGGDPGCPAAVRCIDTEGPTTVNAPELTLSKTASASPWTVGVPASYTLQVSNTGTAATTAAATISDTIPAGLTIGTLPAGCTAAGQTVTCTIASGLAAAASTSFVIPVTPTVAATPSVTNTATVSGGGDPGCPAAARCSDTEGPTTVNAPELTLTKTASAGPWTVGVPASYTLQVGNTGTTATTAAATITDTIPAGLTIGTLPAGCTAAGQTVTCTIASGLAAAASTSFVIPVTPTVAATPSVTNMATVSGGGDPGCPAAVRCSDTEGPTPVDTPELTLTKTASASPWTVGVPASYTLQVSNTGTAATTAAATITDAIPAGLTIGALPVGCTAAGQTVTCTVASGLAAGGSTSFVIPVTPTAAATPSVTNTATVSGGGDPGCPAAVRCTDTEGPTTVNAPELTLTKTASASPWTVGVPASYTLQVGNTGTTATTAAATITDTMPAGLTIGVLPAGCTAAGQTVTCTIASGLAVSASTSFVIPVTPTAAAVPSVTNTATVTGGGDPGCPAAARCTDTEGPTPVDTPELTLTKTASASPWTVGVPASYTLQVGNTGTTATTAAATVTDTIPAGLTIGTMPVGCTAAGQTVTCTVASGLAAGGSTSFVIPVTPTTAAVPSVTNTATVTGGGDPGCPAAARCTDTEGPTPVDTPELTLTKTASASPWTVGVPASYTLQVTNTGAATTAAATITDTIPAGLTIGTLPAGCTAAGQTVTCTIATGLATNASASFVIPVTPTVAAIPSVTNTATVGGGGDAGCPAAARCTDTEGPTPVDTPLLTLTKTASASPWTVGVAASYTLQVTNTGAATTAAATITDTIPAGLTIGTLPAGCTAAGQTVTCTIASGLATNASASFVIPVTPTVAAIPSVTNTATVGGGGDAGCPAAARCTDTEGPTPVDTPLLTLTKTASASPWTVGVAASYTLQVTNTGAATTAAATITDTIPAGLTIGALPVGCTAAGQTVTCTVASGLATNASASFVIPVTPTVAAIPSVTNTATVGGGGDAGCPAETRCTDTEGPTPVDTPLLTLTKTASASPWTVGVAASYTLQVTNTGAATTAAATITDTIPAGLTIGTLPAGCTTAGQTVTCTIATGLATNASASFVIPVTPTAAAMPSVTNTATVSGGGDAGCPAAARCIGTVVTPVQTVTVSVTKSSTPPSGTRVVPGETITYTVQVQVIGAALTDVLELSDTLGNGLVLQSVNNGSFTCNLANPLICSLPIGTPAGAYAISYVAQVEAAATGSVGNVVTITRDGGDDAADCSACTTTHPLANADLEILKTVDNLAPTVGSTVTFTLTVRNIGPDTATNVVATDVLPSGYVFVSAAATQGSFAAPTWNIGTLAAGQTASLQIRARVNPSGDYRNEASVRSDLSDPVMSNNTNVVIVVPRGGTSPVPVPATSPLALLALLLLLSGLGVRAVRRSDI